MKSILAIEIVGNNKAVKHHFSIGNEQGFIYRDTLSYNAFDNVQAKLCAKNPGGRFFHCVRGHELVAMHPIEKEEIRYLPNKVHSSIWEFYKAIGYDYKKKKFNEG